MAVHLEVGGPLFRDRLVAGVRRALSTEGMTTRGYSGHSFRIGAATTASVADVEETVIKSWAGGNHGYAVKHE